MNLKIRLDNVKKEYIELRRDMKSIPKGTDYYKRLEKNLGKFLGECVEKYGQDAINEITGSPPPKVFVHVECPVCGSRMRDRNLVKHMRKRHEK